MKITLNRLILISTLILVIFISSIAYFNRYTVSFYNAEDGQKYDIATMYFNYNEIILQDKWFEPFGKEVSGVVIIENKDQYAYIPYSFTNNFPNDEETDMMSLMELYDTHQFNAKGLFWIQKTDDYDVEVTFGNYRSLSLSIDVTSSSQMQYGYGVLKAPIYNEDGSLYYHLCFLKTDVLQLSEDFSSDTPSYVLQTFRYTEASIIDGDGTTTLLMPVTYLMELSTSPIGDTDHYYGTFNNNQIILEAHTHYID